MRRAEAQPRDYSQPAAPSQPPANARPSARPPDEGEGLAQLQAASRHGRGGSGSADWRGWVGGGTLAGAEGGCGQWGVTQQSRVRVGARVLQEGRGFVGGPRGEEGERGEEGGGGRRGEGGGGPSFEFQRISSRVFSGMFLQNWRDLRLET